MHFHTEDGRSPRGDRPASPRLAAPRHPPKGYVPSLALDLSQVSYPNSSPDASRAPLPCPGFGQAESGGWGGLSTLFATGFAPWLRGLACPWSKSKGF